MDIDNYQKKQKLKLAIPAIIFAIFCVGIIVLAIINQVNRMGKIPVKIQFAPYIADITIDGKKGKNNKTNYLSPGTHELSVTSPNFNTYTASITVDDSSTIFYGTLTPSNEKGEKIAQRYEKEIIEVQVIAGFASIDEGVVEREEWPILQALPIDNVLYSIGYTFNAENRLILTVDTDTTYIDAAINKLISLEDSGYSAWNYDIIIKNYSNPFINQFQENTNSDPLQYLKTGFSSVNCQIHPGTQQDDYYYTFITTGSKENYTTIHSRVVLKQVNGTWEIISTIYPILTKINSPEVPDNILNAVNTSTTSY